MTLDDKQMVYCLVFNVFNGMKVLAKRNEKDYYDYLQNYYGIDELVVYDRRKSFPIDLSNFYIGYGLDILFKKKKEDDDIKQRLVKRRGKEKLEGRILYFVLEVGYHQYYFKVERYLDGNDTVVLEPEIVEKKKVSLAEKISDCPLSLCLVFKEAWSGKFYLPQSYKEYHLVKNPILKNTYIPRFIEPKEIWNNLYEYISSLRDKPFEDTRTNDQHIESHGFDKKISFRHRK